MHGGVLEELSSKGGCVVFSVEGWKQRGAQRKIINFRFKVRQIVDLRRLSYRFRQVCGCDLLSRTERLKMSHKRFEAGKSRKDAFEDSS